jgi:hypothetical protein
MLSYLFVNSAGDATGVDPFGCHETSMLLFKDPSIAKKCRRGRTPLRVLDHVGLLVNGPSGSAGLPFA